MRSAAPKQRHQFVETLEARRLFSVSAASAVAPAILGPSAVEGTYKGVTEGSDGASYELKFVITTTSIKCTVEGVGTYREDLTAAEFLKIRKGKFDVTVTGIAGSKGSGTFTGTIKDSGLKITGDYLNSLGASGTFDVKR